MTDTETNVRVAVRFRPLNSREKSINDTNCVQIDNNQVKLKCSVGGADEHNFAFDFVFDEDCLQSDVWTAIGEPILEKAFSGYNGTIFAYGQTGSGKTWSMQGGNGELNIGIIPRMTSLLFNQIEREKNAHPTMQFLVTASYFELYNEIIFDLLDSSDRRKRSKGGLEIKEHPVLGVYVKSLQEVVIDSAIKMQQLIEQGMSNRTTASTQMNSESSRSHSVFTFKLHQKDSSDESKNLFAKVNLVDLAGSERQKSTGAVGAVLKEGANINKSLSALGNVINALVEQSKGKKGAFIPYRNSKLTRVLQESLGGNSITIMIAAMSKALSSGDETLSTLKYADRAKAIKVNVVKNDESSQVARLNEEIRALKEKLMNQQGGILPISGSDTTELEERHRQQLLELEDAMRNTWEEKARISAGYAEERQRLESEQKEASKRLALQVQEKWRVLDEKKDIDLAVSHVKEAAKSYHPEALGAIGSWQLLIKEFLKNEGELIELDTVVNVYKTSLYHEEKSLSGGAIGGLDAPIKMERSNSTVGNIPVDKSTCSLWKQLRNRFLVFETEVCRWMDIQDKLLQSIGSIKSEVDLSIESLSNDTVAIDTERIPDNYGEMSRGFDLVVKQLHDKEVQLRSDVSNNRSSMLELREIANKILAALDGYETVLSSGSAGNSVEDAEQCNLLCGGILQSTSKINSYYNKFDNYQENVMLERSDTKSDMKSTTRAIKNFLCLQDANGNQIAASCKNHGWWFADLGSSLDNKPSILITLNSAENICSINILRSTFIHTYEMPSSVQILEGNLKSLPNGFSIAACSLNIEDTVTSLGCVLDWNILLKKSAPDKVLQRPPVRFIFDILRHLSETCTLKVCHSNKCPDWEIVGSTKDSKIEFINNAINLISAAVNATPVVSVEAVIAGEDSGNVNMFLQQVAIAAFNSKLESNNKHHKTICQKAGNIIPCQVELSVSADGSLFSSKVFDVKCSELNNYATISLSNLSDTSVRYIRIKPIGWSFRADDNSSCNSVVCGSSIEFSIVANIANLNSVSLSKELNIATSDGKLLLNILSSATSAVSTSLDYIVLRNEVVKRQKEETMKKQMDGLAQEKLLLEERLIKEKNIMASESQSLAEQLKSSERKLHETEVVLQTEANLRLQLQELVSRLENEKKELQSVLQSKYEENDELRSVQLALQTKTQKAEVVIENLRRQSDEQISTIVSITAQIECARENQLNADLEKEEALNQLSIMTEERDVARLNEERLFETLREKSSDLEKLQESYVDMSDRCNDYKDEISDLREQVDSLQDLLLATKAEMSNNIRNSTAMIHSTSTGGIAVQNTHALELHPGLVESQSETHVANMNNFESDSVDYAESAIQNRQLEEILKATSKPRGLEPITNGKRTVGQGRKFSDNDVSQTKRSSDDGNCTYSSPEGSPALKSISKVAPNGKIHLPSLTNMKQLNGDEDPYADDQDFYDDEYADDFND